MVTTTLPRTVTEPETEVFHVPKHLVKELEELAGHTVAEPEIVHWYHFVPCAGVRYYAYHASPSPVESIRPKKP